MKKIILFLTLFFINSCQKQFANPPIIFLQPVNGFSEQQCINILEDFNNNLEKLFGVKAQIAIESNLILPKSLLNKSKTRYHAQSIIEKYRSDSKVIEIFLLKDDIYLYRGNGNEWGILGQSVIGSNVCIVSSYRVKNKNNMWKLVLHEFIHTYFKYMHCPNDDPKCFMKGAKGHANLDKQIYLCNKCKKNLKLK